MVFTNGQMEKNIWEIGKEEKEMEMEQKLQ